ncbi:MAG: type II secretion system protein GspK [Verrucomicrobiia bacterium]
MNFFNPTLQRLGDFQGKNASGQKASVLIIVLWITFGLVSIALYLGQSMMFNLQAADNHEAGVEADQAIEGAARYISFVLTNLYQQVQTVATNMPGILITPGNIQAYLPSTGQTPYTQTYEGQEVPVGNARFWLIGRDAGGTSNVTSGLPTFGLIDEASKLNINTATLDMLEALPFMTSDMAASILNWRNSAANVTAGGAELEYGMLDPPYSCKNAPFETIDELKLVIGVTTDILYGADLNLNGILDPNENNQNVFQTGGNLDNGLNAGILEYVTVYSREPNTQADGSARINISSSSGVSSLRTALQNALGAQRTNQILQQAGLAGTGGQGRGSRVTFGSVMEFYVRSGMTVDEFSQVADALTTTNASYIAGLINVNTAPAPVLACVPGIGPDNAQTLVTYRQAHPDQLATVAWVAQALGTTAAIQAGPYITAKSYQFTADVAAVGHYGRGYRRTVFVFDTSGGMPQIIYRRDITQQSWALGNVRQSWQLMRNM